MKTVAYTRKTGIVASLCRIVKCPLAWINNPSGLQENSDAPDNPPQKHATTMICKKREASHLDLPANLHPVSNKSKDRQMINTDRSRYCNPLFSLDFGTGIVYTET
jgi:hypothetical protein